MEIKKLSKKDGVWEFQLVSEDHTLANLVKELSWLHKAEAGYRVDHPLIGKPTVKVVAKNPKASLDKVAKDIVKLSKSVQNALKL
ncbi:MAG: hypothetical protein GOU98_01960 [Candidatus Altiarchaeota archaeon]|nr:hypothetical protein [Candidatus Altiarchaeota archaeon]